MRAGTLISARRDPDQSLPIRPSLTPSRTAPHYTEGVKRFAVSGVGLAVNESVFFPVSPVLCRTPYAAPEAQA